MRTIAAVSIVVISLAAVALGAEQTQALDRGAIVEVMTAVAEWQLAHPSAHPTDDWTQAPFWIGLNEFAPLSNDHVRYVGAVRRNAEANHWRPGPRPLCADDHAIVQSYFSHFDTSRDRSLIQPALQTFDAVIRYPFDESLEFVSWEKTWRQWTWCDALFMSPPALAMASRATGEPQYLDFMNRMWWKTTDYLYDKDEHLYYRDSRFFEQRTPGGRKVFWSRGNGWVLAGLARVLQNMPADYPERPRYVQLFREMSATVAALQQPDGWWRTSLLDPAALPLPETSGTAFFVYALAWGINADVLDRARFEPVVQRGWSALTCSVHADGMVGWVQRIGDQPGDTSPSGTEIYGAGAFLMAGAEVSRLARPAAEARTPRPESSKNLAERLGYPRDAKLLIIHADDFGLAHAVNAATSSALERGAVNSASVMVPPSWFPEAAAWARAHPDADIGIHLTLTSEWNEYRWRPLAPAASLVDATGSMHPTEVAAADLDPAEVEREVRAQIDRALAAGIRPTHLDTHMRTLHMNSALFSVLLRVAHDYGIPAAIPASFRTSPLASLIGSDDVVIDRFITIAPEVGPEEWSDYYAAVIEKLEPGVTELIVHLGYDNDELRAVAADHPSWGSAWRQRDYDVLTSAAFRRLLDENRVRLITWRDLGKVRGASAP